MSTAFEHGKPFHMNFIEFAKKVGEGRAVDIVYMNKQVFSLSSTWLAALKFRLLEIQEEQVN